MSLTVVINDRATPLLGRIRSAAEAARVSLVGARAVAIQVRGHLVNLQAERHRPGVGDSFYGRAARSVSAAPAGLSATVGIAQRGIRLRRLGGVVRPRAGRKLVAYPAKDAPREAHELGPKYFPDLELSRQINPAHGGLQLCLVRRASTRITITRRKQKDGTIRVRVKAGAVLGGEIVFWLARKTTHKADASVLPTNDEMQATSIEGIRVYFLQIAQRAALSDDDTAQA